MKKYMSQPFFLIGLIFTPIGFVFLLIGILMGINIDAIVNSPNSYGDVKMLPFIFGGLGAIFFIIGGAFVMSSIRKSRTIEILKEKGHYIYGVVTDIYVNSTVMVNGIHPFIVECEYEDDYTREKKRFRSEDLFFEPPNVIGQQVRIYVDPQDHGIYHVDTEALFGEDRYRY